jgi:predicted CopG family antitoxin
MGYSTKYVTIEPETKEKLLNLKRYKRETWNEVIERLIA